MGPRQTATADQVVVVMTGERFTASSRPGSRLASGLGEASDTLQNTAPGLSSGPVGPGPLELEGLGENARLRLSTHCPPRWGECQVPPLPSLPSWRHPLHRRVLPSLSFPNGRLLVGGALHCAVSGRARPAAWEQAEDNDHGDGCLAEGCAPRHLLQCGSRALTQATH